MAKLFILIGIPGSGKSTWAKSHLSKWFDKILSSDEYRKKIYGDATIQTKNNEVFSRIYQDLIKFLQENVDVCFDATNVKIKDRKKVLSIANSISDVEKIAVVFPNDTSKAKKQNLMRSRKVPDFVIDRYSKNLVSPTIEEGFDKIISVDT